MRIVLVLILVNVLVHGFTQAQSDVRIEGPVIEQYGGTFQVDNPDYKLDSSRQYKVVFDIANSPDDKGALNPVINTLARFINMHVAAGIPKENLHVVGVFHNKASKDALIDEAYEKRYGIANPNAGLIKALKDAGVQLYMCGQSIHARKIEREEINPAIGLALSAMTILIDFQSKGYQFIKF